MSRLAERFNSGMNDKLKAITKILGTPFFECDHGLIYNLDCLESMRALPEGILDSTFTSPPYNIGKEYEEIMSLEDYITWSSEWMNEVYRLTKNNGSFWLNVGYMEVPGKGKCVPLTYFLWNLSDFYLQQEIVWNYGAGVACNKRLSPRNEKILWFTKNSKDYTFNLDPIRDPNVKYPNQKKNGKLRCNTIGKNPSDVWQIAKVTSGRNRSSTERAAHPAQTPTDLIDRILLGGTNEGELVMDPFIGSGSLASSAIKKKRLFVGFEINESYCETAAARLQAQIENQNSRLFD